MRRFATTLLLLAGVAQAQATMVYAGTDQPPSVTCQTFLSDVEMAADERLSPELNERLAQAFARRADLVMTFVATELARAPRRSLDASVRAALERYDRTRPPRDPVWSGYNGDRRFHNRAR